jgi:hypothetical protein
MGEGPEMNDTVKANLLEAIRFMMKPLVRLLVNQGVTHSEFSEAMKDVYVETAIRHFSEDHKVNKSRIAILTGMTRKEVKNVIDRALAQEKGRKPKSRPERVLTGWHHDPEYQGPYGLPLELPYESPQGESSFVELVKRYSGDMSPRAMLEELIRGGSVIEVDKKKLKVVRRDFEPTALSAKLITRLGEVGHYVFGTAAANIEKKGQGSGHFDRYAFADDGCTDNVIADLDQYVKDRGQDFLEGIDRWLSANQDNNEPDEKRKDTGVYVCQYVSDPAEKTTLSDLLIRSEIEAGD